MADDKSKHDAGDRARVAGREGYAESYYAGVSVPRPRSSHSDVVDRFPTLAVRSSRCVDLRRDTDPAARHSVSVWSAAASIAASASSALWREAGLVDDRSRRIQSGVRLTIEAISARCSSVIPSAFPSVLVLAGAHLATIAATMRVPTWLRSASAVT